MLDSISKYVYTVYRLNSVSLAAKELFISQPALSAAIKKAETMLGAPIFNRRTLPFSLTPEGKVYIEAIEKMLAIEKQASDRIHDIQLSKSGTLRIGTSTHVSYYAIPKILKLFRANYPQVDIHIITTDNDKLYDLLTKETVDLIFIPAETAPEGFTVVPLFEQRFVVALPANEAAQHELQPFAVSHEALISRTYGRELEITDMSVFHGIEFIYTPPNTNIQKKRKLLFGRSHIPPYITSNTGNQLLTYNLMCSGFGALLTTDANIATMPPSNTCKYFVLGGSAAKQKFSIVYPTAHPSQIANEFVSTAKDLFSQANPLAQFVNN